MGISVPLIIWEFLFAFQDESKEKFCAYNTKKWKIKILKNYLNRPRFKMKNVGRIQ